MSSTSELLARIEELSSAIERQKQVLRDLETSRSDARRDLNVLCDPIARLPLEISSAIFFRCLPVDRYPRPNRHNAPMLFLRVCRLWSEIALATPALWAVVGFIFPYDPNAVSRKHFDLWLNRTRNHPLALSLGGYLTDGVDDAIKQHAHQVALFPIGFG
ncbi:F-box domain-containing protein [Mycena venus]|uniref:F-box domain-containing protein n=1 Tax=Mycena venus TaxID=2733690 RepID=A0A8H6YU47_9AGAR|nr:F-box domain-containing protein [Mycena venus]